MPVHHRFLLSLIALACLFHTSSTWAEYYHYGQDNRWLATAGVGMMIDPTVPLLSLQVEYPSGPNLYFGPMLQMGLGSSTLITASYAGRFVPSGLQPLKPFLEGALGLSGGSGSFGSVIGFHVMLGFGLNYKLDKNIAVASSVRINFCPPVKTAVFTWPMLEGRFAL